MERLWSSGLQVGNTGVKRKAHDAHGTLALDGPDQPCFSYWHSLSGTALSDRSLYAGVYPDGLNHCFTNRGHECRGADGGGNLQRRNHIRAMREAYPHMVC